MEIENMPGDYHGDYIPWPLSECQMRKASILYRSGVGLCRSGDRRFVEGMTKINSIHRGECLRLHKKVHVVPNFLS